MNTLDPKKLRAMKRKHKNATSCYENVGSLKEIQCYLSFIVRDLPLQLFRFSYSAVHHREKEENTDDRLVLRHKDVRKKKINQKATRPGNLNASQRAEVVYIELLSFVSFDDVRPLSLSHGLSFTRGARGKCKGSGDRRHLVIVKEERR